jgi:hypothetical protein
MKTKKYLKVLGKRNDGTLFSNPLKLSEAHLISKIAQENMYITRVQCIEVPESEYNAIFGK